MHVLTVRNVNHALPEALWWLHAAGLQESSRNGPVLVAPGSVAVSYTHPRERVLFSALRDCNPYFHLFESLWMLGGREDVAFPAQFNPRMRDYSDDGKTLHGAYGHRWRHWEPFGVDTDQLQRLVKLLRAKPDTRQAVLSMWSATYDLDAASKDLPCLGGGTRLASPEGALTLKELAQKFANKSISRWPVYSIDPVSKAMKLTWCTKVWKSGVKKVVRLTFDDGSNVVVTPDHRFFAKKQRNKIFCQEVLAGELKVGDHVWATALGKGPKGYLWFKRQLDQNTKYRNRKQVSHAYVELVTGKPVKPGMVVHHDNEDEKDNHWLNLKYITKSEHDRLHRLGDRNPMRRMSDLQHIDRAKKQSAALRKNWSRRTKKELVTHAERTSAGLRASWAKLSKEERLSRISWLPNHKITSIVNAGVRDVYDFEVPDGHSAMLDNGVFVHNCNTHCYLDRRGEGQALNLLVCCRSNDAIWGAYGANAVHFSYLLEYLAGAIGCHVGRMDQLSFNLHVYTENEVTRRLHYPAPDEVHEAAIGAPRVTADDRYVSEGCEPYSLLGTQAQHAVEEFDEDLERFLSDPGSFAPYHCSFFEEVAAPMYASWAAYKAGNLPLAQETLDAVEARDWAVAAHEWLQRRIDKRAHDIGPITAGGGAP